MQVLTLEEIQRRLSDRNLLEVSKRAGVSYHTVRRFATGDLERPTHDTVAKISQYLIEGSGVNG